MSEPAISGGVCPICPTCTACLSHGVHEGARVGVGAKSGDAASRKEGPAPVENLRAELGSCCRTSLACTRARNGSGLIASGSGCLSTNSCISLCMEPICSCKHAHTSASVAWSNCLTPSMSNRSCIDRVWLAPTLWALSLPSTRSPKHSNCLFNFSQHSASAALSRTFVASSPIHPKRMPLQMSFATVAGTTTSPVG